MNDKKLSEKQTDKPSDLQLNSLVISGDDDGMGLKLVNKHLRFVQTVPPTISSGSLKNKTDSSGVIYFTSTGSAGPQTTVTFAKKYLVTPIVQLTPKNVNAGVNSLGYYVTSTLSGFTINASFTIAPIPLEYFYFVTESAN